MADRPTRPVMHRNRTSEGSFHDESMMRESRARQPTRNSRQQRSTSVRTSSPEGPPFACPYSKHDANRYSHKNVEEQDYRNCSSGYWTSIPRLKQHLYRTHDRALRCCQRCWQKFQNDDSLQRHVEALECQPRTMPEEKMDMEKHQQVRERVQGRPPIESWYTIYHILFPSDDLPPSPFAEWVTGNDLRLFFDMLMQRLPRMLFHAAVQRHPAAGNIPMTRQTEFPTTVAVVHHALQLCQKQFGSDMRLTHVFDTESPTFTTSPRGTSGRVSQTTSPTQTRHSHSHSRSHNVSESDEYEDSSSDVGYYDSAAQRRAATSYQPQNMQPFMVQPMYDTTAYTAAGYHAATAAPMEGIYDDFDIQEGDFTNFGMENM